MAYANPALEIVWNVMLLVKVNVIKDHVDRVLDLLTQEMDKEKEIKFAWNVLPDAWSVIAILLVAKAVAKEHGLQSTLISWVAIYVQMDASLAMMQQHVLSAFSATNLMEIFAYQTVKDRAALA
jgi:hypothetical protein